MKYLLAGLLAVVAGVTSMSAAAASLTNDTTYTEEVISTQPLRIQYTLKGHNGVAPADFAELGIRGDATFVFALAGKEVMLYSEGLYIVDPNRYHWPYPAFVNPDPSNPIAAVHASGGFGFSFEYALAANDRFPLSAQFIVEYQPWVVYNPEHLHMQAVYFSAGLMNPPFIDVFRRAPQAR